MIHCVLSLHATALENQTCTPMNQLKTSPCDGGLERQNYVLRVNPWILDVLVAKLVLSTSSAVASDTLAAIPFEGGA